MEPALRPIHDDFIQRYLRTNEARVVNTKERRVYAVHKNGKKLPVLLSLTTMSGAGENFVFVAVFQKVRPGHFLLRHNLFWADHEAFCLSPMTPESRFTQI